MMECNTGPGYFEFPNWTSENYFIKNLETYVQAKFDELCKEHNIQYISIKNLFVQANSTKKCDFTLMLKSKECCQILPFVNALNLKLGECRFFSKVDYFVESNQLFFYLDRSFVFRSVIQEVMELKEAYGMQKQSNKILIVVHNESENLNSLRNNSVTEHLISFLVQNGYRVYCNDDRALKIPYLEKVKQFQCTEKCKQILTDMQYQWEKTIKHSRWLVSFDTKSSEEEALPLILDSQKYLNSTNSSKRCYKNVGNILVKRESFSFCFHKFLEIVHLLEDHLLEAPDHIFHIVSQNKELAIQHTVLLSEMVYDERLIQSYIIHQKTFVKNQPEILEKDYLAAKEEELQSSLVHRYGQDVIKDETWKSCLKTLVKTCIMFDVLLTGLSAPLKLEMKENAEFKSQDKGGTFVQYNFARLSMLFKSYDQKVTQNYYGPLPPMKEVDFTLLNLQEEWNLLLNFVITFPKIIQDILVNLNLKETVKAKFLSHKVCQMFVSLSRELSIYYSKVHILGGQQLHLQKRMFAQLYLLMSIQQVLKNGFMCLNIKGLHEM